MKKKLLSLLLVGCLLASFVVIFQPTSGLNGVQTQKIDSVGIAGTDASIALDSKGYPHISYNDGNDSGLKYAWWNGTAWNKQVVENGGVTGRNGMFSQLRLDSNDNPHIVYHNLDSTYHLYVRYAYWSGQAWVCQTVDPSGGSQHSSLALDSHGNPHISYYGASSMKYASWSGSGWQIQVVDPGVMFTLSIGTYSSLQIDSNDKAHIAYYDGTNELLKYAFWNGSTWIIETVDSDTPQIENSLALDANNNPYISYAFSVGLRYAKHTASGWSIQTVDTTGDPKYNVAASPSLALDSKGIPHIAYIDQYRSGVMKYAFLNSSSWVIYGLTGAARGGHTVSLALDKNNTAHIVHGDYNVHVMEYMHFNPANLGAPNPVPNPTPPVAPPPLTKPVSTPGTPIVLDYGNSGMYTSIALDSKGNPSVSYFDGDNGLKYASSNGTFWRIETVDVSGWYGRYTSLAFDADNHPHISYFDNINSSLKYAYWNGSAWALQTVDKGGLGSFTSIVIDSKGNPQISYFDAYNPGLKYAKWNGTIWSIQKVDSAGMIGECTSLALDSTDKPHISYYDITNCNLKYAVWTGSNWNIQSIDSAGDVGWSTSLKIDADNTAHISYLDRTNQTLKYATSNGSSWNIQTVDYVGNTSQIQDWSDQTSLALDSSGYPHIGYIDGSSNHLKYAYWNGTSWVIQTADSSSNVGWCASLALDTSGRAHLSYFDASNRDLRYICLINSTGFPNTSPTPTPLPTTTPTPTPTTSPTPKPSQTSTPKPTPSATPFPQPLLPTILDLTCKSTSQNNAYKATIEGKLTANNFALTNADIYLAYSVTGAENWIDLSPARTDSEGCFYSNTTLPATGICLVNAVYRGNLIYQSASKVVSFVVVPIKNQDVLSISSNSTVSQLAFNSKTSEFSFIVNGTTGTTGYVGLTVAKSLLNSPSHLTVYLDESKLPYTVESQGDFWEISFTYHHSSHIIKVQLIESSSNDQTSGYWIIVGLTAPIVIAVIVISLIYRTKRTKAKHPDLEQLN